MATKSTPRVLGGERRRRAPGADGPLVNASDHAARWYGVHCSPPLAPADQGDRSKPEQNPDGFSGANDKSGFSGPRTKTRAIRADSEAKPHRDNEAVLPAAPGNAAGIGRRAVK